MHLIQIPAQILGQTQANPLVPMWLDVLLSVLSIAGVIILVMGIFSVSNAMKAEKVSAVKALLIIMGMLLIPLVGPLFWFWYRKRLDY